MLGRFLDALVVGVPASALLALAGLPAPTIGLGGTEAWVRSAVTAVLWFAYHVVLEARTGATVGKRLATIRVEVEAGRSRLLAAATRNLWLLLGLVPLVGGFLLVGAVLAIAVTIDRRPAHRGVHDAVAGTTVVSGAAAAD